MKQLSAVVGVAVFLVLWTANAWGQVELQGPAASRVPAVEPQSLLEPDAPSKETTVQSDSPTAATQDVSTGRQEPSISLEWVSPPILKLGQPVLCHLVVKNASPSAVHQVVVRNRLPSGVNVKGTEPRCAIENNVMLWEIGTLQARQEKKLAISLIPETKGDLECHAQVTFTGTSVAKLRVREPKLLLKATAPERVVVGESAAVTFMVSNPGDGPTENVKVKVQLPEALEHERGKTIEFDLGNLAASESRSFQLVCVTKAGGSQKCEAVATADGNLTSQDAATLEVTLPRLDLTMSGPKLRYLDRHAIYVITVTNAGSAPASSVNISDVVPAGFRFVGASAGGRYDQATRTVSWFLGDLTPNQSRELSLEVVAIATGDHKHKATAVAGRGLKTEAEAMTRVEGLSALLMELVDVDDPVEVGADTCYEIRITNTGSKTETNLQLVCTIPEKMEYRGAKSAANVRHRVQGKELVFEPLPKLAPRADVVYRVHVRGTTPGDLRFRARITADGLTDPVLKEESTKVYGDELSGK